MVRGVEFLGTGVAGDGMRIGRWHGVRVERNEDRRRREKASTASHTANQGKEEAQAHAERAAESALDAHQHQWQPQRTCSPCDLMRTAPTEPEQQLT
jgi:hypothetical protein